MDSTQPLSAIKLDSHELVSHLRSVANDLSRLEREFLDGLLKSLGFDRGLLFRVRGENSRLNCGRRLSDGGVVREVSPDLFPMQSSGLPDALVDQVIQSDESSIRLFTSSSEPQFVVLCQSCPLIAGERIVLYMDVPVDSLPPEVASTDLAGELEATLGAAWPLIRSAYLEQDLLRMRSERVAMSVTEPETGESVDDEESEDGEEAWVLSHDELPTYHGIIGESEGLKKIYEVVEKIKDTDFNVCVLGESGTGKELLAQAIHYAGCRSEAKFVSESCGAISETLLESELFGHVKGAFTGADESRKGLFELANGGTLFLDEIGDMSEGMQRKLLRVLQEGIIRPIGSKEMIHVDVRVIYASNRDLRLLVEKGTFRADLYYRLNVITLEIPPLRDRMDDVPLLVKGILTKLQKAGFRRRLSRSALRALMSYSWPGNVRELENVLQRLAVTGTRRLVTRKEILPLLDGGPARSYVGEGIEDDEGDNQIVLRIPQRQTFNEIISECEKAVLLNSLKENRWNKSRVTKVLQIPRQSLYNKIAKYKLRKKLKSEA